MLLPISQLKNWFHLALGKQQQILFQKQHPNYEKHLFIELKWRKVGKDWEICFIRDF